MLIRSFWIDGHLTFAHYLSVFSDGRCLDLLFRSLGIALAATVFSLALGLVQALLIARTNIAAKAVWRRLYLLPLCIPPHIHAIAWIYLCGETGWLNRFIGNVLGSTEPVLDIYGPAWTVIILALAYHPLVTLMIHGGLLAMDRRLEEAACQYHPTGTVLRKVTVPLLLPHIFSGAIFVFIFSFFNYGVPALLRVHTYPVEIFAQFSAFYNEAAAMALSVPVIVVAVGLLLLQRHWMKDRDYVVIDTGRRDAAPFGLGLLERPAIVFMVLLCSAAIGLPLSVLFWQAHTPAVFGALWQTAADEILFTALLSFAAAGFISLLAFLLAAAAPVGGRQNTWRDFFYYMPLSLPAVVLGMGLIYFWNRPMTAWIYGSVLILIIAYAARFLPFSLQATLAGMRQIGPGLREASLLYQGAWWKRTLKIEIPMCLPALLSAWSIAFILCMSELGATLLVIPPGMGTIALKIYNLMHYGANQIVAALSVVLIGINLVLAASAMLSISRLNWLREAHG